MGKHIVLPLCPFFCYVGAGGREGGHGWMPMQCNMVPAEVLLSSIFLSCRFVNRFIQMYCKFTST